MLTKERPSAGSWFQSKRKNYRGAEKSLARPGTKQSYSEQTLTFARH
jgi:hypothetical protein